MIKLVHHLRLTSISFLLLIAFSGYSQNVSETFSNEIFQAFSGLDKNRVPHGLLLDFAMDFTNVEAFNGQLSDSTSVDLETYIYLYHTMLMSRVQNITEDFMLPQAFATTWANLRRENNFQPEETGTFAFENPTIVLSGIFYEYSKIRKNALSQGDIAITNNQYQDVFVNGQWQNVNDVIFLRII